LESDTYWKRSVTTPRRRRLLLRSQASWTRTPSTMVPFRLFMSMTRAPPSPITTSQWKREMVL
jgi:hypothetical protein